MLIGAHVSPAGGLDKSIERGVEKGCQAIQIFNQSPRMWRPTAYGEDDFAAFKAAMKPSPIKAVLIHAVYLLNCASEDAEIRDKSRTSLVQSLRVGADIKPVRIGDALLVSSPSAEAWRFQVSAEAVFVLNLTPRAKYDVEVDDEELWEVDTDAGGTMVLSFPEGMNSGVRIKRR